MAAARRFGRSISALVGAAGICALSAQAQRAEPGKPDFTFPQKVGPAELVGTEDFEAKQPGLGQLGRYKFQGWTMGVYVYDRGRRDLPDTAVDALVKPELAGAAADLMEARKLGHYADVAEGHPFAIPPAATRGVFQCRSFRLTRRQESGQAPSPRDTYDSFVCVTIAKKRFVKLRLSSETPSGDQATVFTPAAAAIELFGRVLQR
jgi:hypothetical protein